MAASWSLLGIGFGGAVALCGLVVLLAQHTRLVAVPNLRSSHTHPTPTAGGIGIAVPIVVWLLLAGTTTTSVLAVAGAAVAAIGLVDDARDLSWRLRLSVQLVTLTSVAWLVWQDLPVAALAVVVAALLWFVNLYNFMDGIDGIASVQVLVFCLGAQLVAVGVPGWLGGACWLTAGTAVGFLVYNWPPARLFMGDVGSGFLGLILGVVAVELWRTDALPLVASAILLVGFWFDASWTLCVRIVTGQRFLDAHKSHLYQRVAARKGHRWTTTAFAMYGVGWLLPLAILCVQVPNWQWAWLALATLPLGVAAVRLRAGMP